jgi:hypothetical protein
MKLSTVRHIASIPLLTVVLSAALPTISLAAKHERNWQTGKLLDAQKSRIYLGSYGTANTYGNANAYGDSATYNTSSNTTTRARYAVEEVEVVESGDKVYVISRLLKYRWNKEADVTVNAPIKFAIEGHNMYLLGEDGREYKTKIIKKTLK